MRNVVPYCNLSASFSGLCSCACVPRSWEDKRRLCLTSIATVRNPRAKLIYPHFLSFLLVSEIFSARHTLPESLPRSSSRLGPVHTTSGLREQASTTGPCLKRAVEGITVLSLSFQVPLGRPAEPSACALQTQVRQRTRAHRTHNTVSDTLPLSSNRIAIGCGATYLGHSPGRLNSVSD